MRSATRGSEVGRLIAAAPGTAASEIGACGSPHYFLELAAAHKRGSHDLEVLRAAKDELVSGVPQACVELRLVAPALQPWLSHVVNAVLLLNDVRFGSAADQWRQSV